MVVPTPKARNQEAVSEAHVRFCDGVVRSRDGFGATSKRRAAAARSFRLRAQTGLPSRDRLWGGRKQPAYPRQARENRTRRRARVFASAKVKFGRGNLCYGDISQNTTCAWVRIEVSLPLLGLPPPTYSAYSRLTWNLKSRLACQLSAPVPAWVACAEVDELANPRANAFGSLCCSA